jgi:hypothetical protein
VIKPGSIAIISLVFGQYLTKPFYLGEQSPPWASKGLEMLYDDVFIML